MSVKFVRGVVGRRDSEVSTQVGDDYPVTVMTAMT